MIKYTLKCTNGHRFDSWFQSTSAFDKLKAGGLVSCAICGSTDVEKAIMAPRVRPARSASKQDAAEPAPQTVGTGLPPEQQKALAQLKSHIEKNSDYVGDKFASEARAMHLGDVPERAIYGEAKPEEAKRLIDDGIPVAPLPFVPGRKTN